MIPIISKFFDSNDKEVTKLFPLIEEINLLEEKTKKLKDTDFPKKTNEFKKRIQDGESLDAILPEAFALVREAARRTTGLRHFDVQLMAAVALSRGKIAEQKTGEGKTLSAVPALYLNALSGNSVHLVTVNDYLARRDAGWMGPIFSLLGMSVSSIIAEQSFVFDPNFIDENAHDVRLTHLRPITRKEAYKCEVVYGINSEFGFDYLRDNMAQDQEQISQTGHFFAVVDEVDSVLIDEARTPHIISAPDAQPTQKYYEYASLVDKLSSETDYKIDEKMRTAHLTDHGIGKVEKIFGIKDIYEKDFDTVYHLEAALKARTLYQKEKDYIVKDNQVILVDEFTGRLMQGRRLSEGLHQALEAKENVPIQRESKTLATVSLQNYFRMYEKLAGMTGTAATEAEEFHKIYGIDVITIPTNNPMKRIDHADVVYKTTRAKYSAVAQDIEDAYKKGQPVLVGTTSIDKNEIISQLLIRKKIPHEVLNAKNHEREAEIISKAGQIGAVTVATNMAGRGVDIILGGEPPTSDDAPAMKKWEKEHEKVIDLGGLYVIGTERHESRRIDNQLRGRSGRQGDPGASRFFVALDDEIMRLFGGDKIAGIMSKFNMPEDTPLSHGLVSRAIEQAQSKVEGFYFQNRKNTVEYDDVLNKQREIIYGRRREILKAGANTKDTILKDQIKEKIQLSIRDIVTAEAQAELLPSGIENESRLLNINERIVAQLVTIINFDEASQKQIYTQLEQLHGQEEKIDFLVKLSSDLYDKREVEVGSELMRFVEKAVMLEVSDRLWMDNLDAMEHLRQGIGLRGYGQRDPLVEYKNEGFRMFEKLIRTIDDELVHRIYRVQIQNQPLEQKNTNQNNIELNRPQSEISQSGRIAKPKVAKPINENKLGRNDLCWCGSGKKWKKCHWPQLA